MMRSHMFSAGRSKDPYFSSVKLLMHCDGADGGTSFIDNSTSAHTFTAGGGITTSTTQIKFGSASIIGDGVDNGLTVLGTLSDFNIGTGDFTLECWVYPTASAAFGVMAFLDSGTVFLIQAVTLVARAYGPVPDSSTAAAVSQNVWTHVAWSRVSGTLYTGIGGTVENLGAYATDINSATTAPRIGRDGGAGSYFTGHIDDLRLTVGVGRYTANFTPPVAAFPDS